MRYRILSTLSIILIVLPFVACSSPQPSTPVGDPATLIQEAKNALDGNNYDLAIEPGQTSSTPAVANR